MSLSPPSGTTPPAGAVFCDCPLCRAFPETIRQTDEQPVRAFKVAYIGPDHEKGGKLAFWGIANNKYSYDGVSSRFRCACISNSMAMTFASNSPCDHSQIGRNTSCGFYAMKSERLMRRQTKNQDYYWLLEVDLWGRVIKGKEGYRAEKQRVLSARPYSRTNLALGEVRQGTANMVTQHDKLTVLFDGSFGMLQSDHRGPKIYAQADLMAELGVEIRAYDPTWEGEE